MSPMTRFRHRWSWLYQRLMNMLSTPLQEGPGYPMDARLRPTGTRGPLVVTRTSWLDYYINHAELWEIECFFSVKARSGDPELAQWIDEKASRNLLQTKVS